MGDPSLKGLVPFAATVGNRRRRFSFADLDWIGLKFKPRPSLASGPWRQPLVLGDTSARPRLGVSKFHRLRLAAPADWHWTAVCSKHHPKGQVDW